MRNKRRLARADSFACRRLSLSGASRGSRLRHCGGWRACRAPDGASLRAIALVMALSDLPPVCVSAPRYYVRRRHQGPTSNSSWPCPTYPATTMKGQRIRQATSCAPLTYPRLPPVCAWRRSPTHHLPPSPISAPCHPLVTCATPRPPGLTHPQARSAPPSPRPVQPPAPPAPRAATWLCAPCKPPRRIRRAALPAPSRVGIRAPAPGPPAPPGPALGRPGSQPAGSSASAA